MNRDVSRSRLTMRQETRSFARLFLRSFMRVTGRSAIYRLGRLLMNEARFDVPNDPSCNGEALVQATVLRHRRGTGKLIVFDIGANVGDWTRTLFEQASDNADLEIHAFEPCGGTYDILVERLESLWTTAQVRIVRKACSRSPGTAGLHVAGVGSGTNSLTCVDQVGTVEEVELTSVDEYCDAAKIDHVTFA